MALKRGAWMKGTAVITERRTCGLTVSAFVAINLILAARVCAAETESSDKASTKSPQAVQLQSVGRWLLDFSAPMGMAVASQNGGRPDPGFTVFGAFGRMMTRFLWLSAVFGYDRTGFTELASYPPQYYHLWAWRGLLRTGLGFDGRVIGVFGTVSFGYVGLKEEMSDMEQGPRAWSGSGLHVNFGAAFLFRLHSRVSLGLAGAMGWDFPLSNDPETDFVRSFSFFPMLRFYL